MLLTKNLIKHIEGLEVSQGQGVGDPLRLFPWERRFLRGAFAPDVSTAALSVARGNGKSTLLAAVADAVVDGPLVQRRGETVVVASSFSQSRIIFEHVLSFLGPVIERDGEGKNGRFRILDSLNTATCLDRRTGARVRCIASDPRRGARPGSRACPGGRTGPMGTEQSGGHAGRARDFHGQDPRVTSGIRSA